MERTWMPTAAGVLTIVSGVFGLIGGLVLTVFGIVGGEILRYFTFGTLELLPLALLSVVGIPVLLLGILALVGGIYALQRKTWGLALAGSISALLLSRLLGIPAIIFTALSQKEFK